MSIEYPKTLSVSELHEVDGLVMSKEICNRYNSHELLCNEIERLQHNEKLNKRYTIGYKILTLLMGISLIILIFTNHVS